MFLGISEPWNVEAYDEDPPSRLVETEFLTLSGDPQVGIDASRLMGWLKAVRNGNGSPEHEPDAPPTGGYTLKYRCVGSAVVIFSIDQPPRLVVLRFARSASAYPTTADCSVAANRWKAWRP
jgi:hypothetical protein